MDKLRDIILDVEAYKAQKDFKTALQMLENSVLEFGEDYRIYEEIGDIYLYEGKLSKAKKAVDYALNINPDSATGNYLKGFILLSYSKIEDALKFLNRSNELMPNNAEVLRNIGWAYCMTGDNEKGITILKRALNLSPQDPLITEDLAMALIGIGKLQEGNSLLQTIGKIPIKI